MNTWLKTLLVFVMFEFYEEYIKKILLNSILLNAIEN